MNKTLPLSLPKTKPSAEVIKSWTEFGDCIENYDPKFWRLQYSCHRYLENISDQELVQRYKDICKNFQYLTGNGRNTTTILSYLSSWYWYRKEYQTRYEFYLRKLPLKLNPPNPKVDSNSPYNSRFSTPYKVLFRYGKSEHMRSFVEKGEIRISPASEYNKGLSKDPRTDDELNKHQIEHIKGNKIFTLEGEEIQLKNGIKWTSSTDTNYYLLSLSTNFEPFMFDEFGYDSCVVIKSSKEFQMRLNSALDQHIPDWESYNNVISYYDPYEKAVENEYFSATMTKDFKFAYQMEYRYLWQSKNDDSAKDYITVDLGCLKDICDLYSHDK